jgi:hypothetical protein
MLPSRGRVDLPVDDDHVPGEHGVTRRVDDDHVVDDVRRV